MTRRRIYHLLEQPSRADRLSWFVELALIALIIASVVAVALETVPELFIAWYRQFQTFDLLVTLVFTVEYAARLWVSVEAAPDLPPWEARLRHALTPIALIDLVAILPFYLTLFMPLEMVPVSVPDSVPVPVWRLSVTPVFCVTFAEDPSASLVVTVTENGVPAVCVEIAPTPRCVATPADGAV